MAHILIFIGGGAGSLLRYLTTVGVNSLFEGKFTLGTFAVNCIGSLLIGFLVGIFDSFQIDSKWKLFAITGFLGGYTTYSAYAYETINYIMNGSVKYAFINIMIHNVMCLALVVLGIWLGRVALGKA